MIDLNNIRPELDITVPSLSSISFTGDDVKLIWPNIPDCFKSTVQSEHEGSRSIFGDEHEN